MSHNQEISIKLAEGVYSIGKPEGNFYSLVVISDEGVAIIDPARKAHAKVLMEEIKKLTTQPIKYLFYTHNHWDHTKGGQLFKEAGALVIAHKEAFEWLEANQDVDLVQPDAYWHGSDTTYQLGDIKIDLHYYGINHGMGMTVFELPKEKIVYIADIVIPHRVIYTIVPDFTPTEWIRTLKEVEKLNFKTAIFSHGSDGKFKGGKAQVTEVREFLEDLRAAVKIEFDKGTPLTEIPKYVDLPQYHDWDNYDDWIEMNAMRMALDFHFGPYPWRKIE
jgi:glyoxylase-like metal-dependent hydrolase (beta-lactamase superfamily II)